MTPLDSRYPDILRDLPDPDTRRFVADFDRVCAATVLPTAHRAAIARALAQRATPPPRWRAQRWARVPPRLGAALLAALVLSAGGLAGYLQLQSPAPVSAQALLRRVALAPSTPNRVIHQVWSETSFGRQTGRGTSSVRTRSEMWTQVDARGAVTREAETQSDSGGLLGRSLRTRTVWQRYSARTATLVTEAPLQSSCAADAPVPAVAWGVPMLLDRSFLLDAARRSRQDLRLLPSQSLAGVAVAVVEVSTMVVDSMAPGRMPTFHRVTVRLYIDPRMSLIRGQDITTFPAHGAAVLESSLRLERFESLPLAAVPASVFQLRIPPPARQIRSLLPAPPCLLTVRHAATQVQQTAPVLSGHPAGLSLARITRDVQNLACGQAATFFPSMSAIVFAYPARGFNAPATKGFCVAISLQPVPPLLVSLAARTQMLTVAGMIVTARTAHIEDGSGEGGSYVLWYRVHARAVVITGARLTRKEFLAAVGALVSSRTHPATVSALQHDLDAFAGRR